MLRLLGVANKRSMSRLTARYIKKRGCQLPRGPILPYTNPDGTVIWLEFAKKVLEGEDLVAILSAPVHYNDYLEEFPERVMVQMHKYPLHRDNLYHCSHVINSNYDALQRQQVLRDSVGDWYPTRSFGEGRAWTKEYSTSFFNTYRDVYRLTFIWLKPYVHNPQVRGLTKYQVGYMKRI